MRPAWSVVFLTTLIGAGQGLVLALYGVELLGGSDSPRVFVSGAIAAGVLTGLGLVASFFHLGRPERAWRTAAMWRTSWLSREVIALPAFMAATAAYGWAHHTGSTATLAIGAVAAIACVALFVCTSQIYACVKFLQEWASPFTLPNFALMGCASGFLLAAALAAIHAPAWWRGLAWAALVLAAVALVVRIASLARNRRIRHKSTLQSAIGVSRPQVRQVSQGFTAGAFNTHEFFHGVTAGTMRRIEKAFLLAGFVLPMAAISWSLFAGSTAPLVAAFLLQYAGLLLERWYFLADSRHPQNLYYERIA
jgi:DMSO reductase anchor subunit